MTNVYYPESEAGIYCCGREYTDSIHGLERAKEDGAILCGKAVLCDYGKNLHVEFGNFKGIIPRQEAVYNPSGEDVRDIAVITRVGKTVCFKITQIEQSDEGIRVLLSRKEAQNECCNNYISRLMCGDVIDAVVTHMESFGVFCDIGCGMTALLPIDCISVSRIGHPSERFEVGQKIRCVIKNIEYDICRVTLTHKELLGTWEENAESFNAGETACGIVRSVESYGIFVELSPNLAGLAEYCDGVYEGQTAAVYIKSIIPEKMKIKLVIIGVSDESCPKRDERYYFDGEHMDGWKYSPEGCLKEIYSVF